MDQRGTAVAGNPEATSTPLARVGLGELVEHLVDLALAAEEAVRLLAAEWPQTGIGATGRRCGSEGPIHSCKSLVYFMIPYHPKEQYVQCCLWFSDSEIYRR